jgi:hypothetical protein
MKSAQCRSASTDLLPEVILPRKEGLDLALLL